MLPFSPAGLGHVLQVATVLRYAGPWGGLASARVGEPLGVYRPRHPEWTTFYRVIEGNLDAYLGTYKERFEARSGPLRSVVARAALFAEKLWGEVLTPVAHRHVVFTVP